MADVLGGGSYAGDEASRLEHPVTLGWVVELEHIRRHHKFNNLALTRLKGNFTESLKLHLRTLKRRLNILAVQLNNLLAGKLSGIGNCNAHL